MNEFVLTNEAKDDLWNIFSFGVNRFGITQAEKYLKSLYKCIDKICINPELFPVAIGYVYIERYCVCGNNTIYYNFKKDIVEIVTIIGRQDF